MLKLELTLVEIDELEDEVIDWVELFEKYAFFSLICCTLKYDIH